jgi:hypothetical protein
MDTGYSLFERRRLYAYTHTHTNTLARGNLLFSPVDSLRRVRCLGRSAVCSGWEGYFVKPLPHFT